jgi:hypothetical protein
MARACAFVYASDSRKAFDEVRDAAARLMRNHLSTLVRLIVEIQRYKKLPPRYGQRLTLAKDSVAGTEFVDMRVILTARLLLLNPRSSIKHWVMKWRAAMLNKSISAFDKSLLLRLVK